MLGLVGGAPGGGDTARRSREGLDDGLGEGLGRLRVLARDELAALRDDDVRRPGVALAVLAALAREALLVRAAEGLDGLRLADLVLFDLCGRPVASMASTFTPSTRSQRTLVPASLKHVTSRPATSGVPSGLRQSMSPMGPWQTAPTTFPAAYVPSTTAFSAVAAGP